MEGFIKYHKIKRLGDLENKHIFLNPDDEIVIQEKIDGGNFRFMISNGKVIIGSRTQQLTDDEGEDSNMNKMFKRCADFVREKITATEIPLDQFNGLIFFGENCVKHTMSYDFDNMPPFLGFDIYSISRESYLDWTETHNLYETLNLPMVPLINRTYAKNICEVTDDNVPDSKYALESAVDKKAEGIVFKNYKEGIFAKYVRDAFKEKNSEAFGGNPKYNKVDDTNDNEFLFKYITNARIEKLIFKAIDEGNELDMKIMPIIIKGVYLDTIEEEWREIMTSNWKLDFKNIRRLCAARVRSVLSQVITNNGLNK